MDDRGKDMLYITICDDEEIIAQKMKQIIKREAKKLNVPIVIEMYANGGEFLSQYQMKEKESLSCAPFQIIRKMSMDSDIPLAIERYLKEWERQRPVLEFKGKGRAYRLESGDILYMEKYKHYVIVHQKKGEDIKIRGNMQDLESELSARGFVRVHTGYLVNLQHCYSLEEKEVVLREGLRIPISRSRKKLVREQFMVNRR